MTPYIRFCSCQLNAAALIQRYTENSSEFREIQKVFNNLININPYLIVNVIVFLQYFFSEKQYWYIYICLHLKCMS